MEAGLMYRLNDDSFVGAGRLMKLRRYGKYNLTRNVSTPL
jgi:hypothetical protein